MPYEFYAVCQPFEATTNDHVHLISKRTYRCHTQNLYLTRAAPPASPPAPSPPTATSASSSRSNTSPKRPDCTSTALVLACLDTILQRPAVCHLFPLVVSTAAFHFALAADIEPTMTCTPRGVCRGRKGQGTEDGIGMEVGGVTRLTIHGGHTRPGALLRCLGIFGKVIEWSST